MLRGMVEQWNIRTQPLETLHVQTLEILTEWW
jgi:hypothetical protein